MAKKFSELAAKMPPEALAQAEVKLQTLLAAMPLHELRRARGLSQKALDIVARFPDGSVNINNFADVDMQ